MCSEGNWGRLVILLGEESPWCHQMETFSALLAFCAGNSPVTCEFSIQRPVMRALIFSLICTWTNSWANNGDAGDLRCHHAHYDVTVMSSAFILYQYITMTSRHCWNNSFCESTFHSYVKMCQCSWSALLKVMAQSHNLNQRWHIKKNN